MENEYRITLDEKNLISLVKGEIVEFQFNTAARSPTQRPSTVLIKIALQDIGFDVMRKAINTAEF